MLLVSSALKFLIFKQNSMKQTISTPYYLASNGLAEHTVQIFKQGMKRMSEGCLGQKLVRFYSVTGLYYNLSLGWVMLNCLINRVELSQTTCTESFTWQRPKSRNFMLEKLCIFIAMVKDQHGWKEQSWIHQVHLITLLSWIFTGK